MKEQSVNKRTKNFNEVCLGFTEREAIIESKRCLQCKNPLCVQGCPANINIPLFIKYITKKDFKRAITTIKQTNNLPAVCGRVCPQEQQCKSKCVLSKTGKPINIAGLERFAANWAYNNHIQKKSSSKKKQKIAVIGSGPSGLTCAADLATLGYNVTIFEALHEPGGVLTYGIPEFRLPKEIVKQEIENIKKLDVKIQLNYLIGKTETIANLTKQGFRAFFIATGAGLPKFIGIPGENLNGVYTANEFLIRINLMKAYKFPKYDTPYNIGKNIAVLGGGNVAIDAARCAIRLGAKNVYIVYRRTKQEMPARNIEIKHAVEEGIKIYELKTPIKIEGNTHVHKLICQENKLGKIDKSGRKNFVPIKNSKFELQVDNIIIAIGSKPNRVIFDTIKNIKLEENNYLKVKEPKNIFLGGDVATGSATVIAAVEAGKKAALQIDLGVRSSHST